MIVMTREKDANDDGGCQWRRAIPEVASVKWERVKGGRGGEGWRRGERGLFVMVVLVVHGMRRGRRRGRGERVTPSETWNERARHVRTREHVETWDV